MKRRWHCGAAVVLALACGPRSADALITSLNLSEYAVVNHFSLPPAAEEASAITFNADRGTLFVLGDEGDALVEITPTGALVSTMTLTGFDDTEGLTYTGGGQFVLVEERLQTAYRLTYVPGGSAARSSLASVNLAPTVGNIGLEGISFDPADGSFVVVKEKTPQLVRRAMLDFGSSAASGSDLFTPNLSVLDLSDVQTLSTVPSLAGRPDGSNLLIYSQESALLLEVTPAGAIESQFSFAALAGDAEGVTIDGEGTIYIAGEAPEVFVLRAVPEPGIAAATAVALCGCMSRRRRRA